MRMAYSKDSTVLSTPTSTMATGSIQIAALKYGGFMIATWMPDQKNNPVQIAAVPTVEALAAWLVENVETPAPAPPTANTTDQPVDREKIVLTQSHPGVGPRLREEMLRQIAQTNTMLSQANQHMSITNNLSDLSARSQGKNQWQGQTAGAVYRPELSAVSISTARTNPHTPKSLLGWAMNSLDSWGFSRPGD